MGGKAPTATPVQVAPAMFPPGYGFSESFYNQVLPKLLNADFPRFTGSPDPGLSPTMAATLRGAQTFASQPFSPQFEQAGHTLGGLMNVNYENPMASVDPNRYGFDYGPEDFRSTMQAPKPGLPASPQQAAGMMTAPPAGSPFGNPGTPPGAAPRSGSVFGAGTAPPGSENESPPQDPGGEFTPENPDGTKTATEGGIPLGWLLGLFGGGGGGTSDPAGRGPLLGNPANPGGKPSGLDLNFGGVRPYQPIQGGQGFVDYNPGSPEINMVRGLQAGSSYGNPMPPGPIGGPPGSPGGPGGGGGGGGGGGNGSPPPNFDPGGVVPGNQLTWFGQWHGPNKGKSMDEIRRDMYERGWDFGPNFQKPEGWGERGSKQTTWAEVMRMPANRRAPGSPGGGGAPAPAPGGGGGQVGTTDPRRVTGAGFSTSGAPAGGK